MTIDGNSVIRNAAEGVLNTSAVPDMAVDGLSFVGGANAFILSFASTSVAMHVDINHMKVTDGQSLGVYATGNFQLTAANTTFARLNAPAIMPSGSGTVSLDNVTLTDCRYAVMILGVTESAGLTAKMRNVTVSGGHYAAVTATAMSHDSFDFGTPLSPGNNAFHSTHATTDCEHANFTFTQPAEMIVPAVSNPWDASQQGADNLGHYFAPSAPGVLLVSSATGPNYCAASGNAGSLMLAGSM